MFDAKEITRDLELILLSPGSVAEYHVKPALQKAHPELSENEVWVMACKQVGEMRRTAKEKAISLLKDADEYENSIKTSKNRRLNKGTK